MSAAPDTEAATDAELTADIMLAQRGSGSLHTTRLWIIRCRAKSERFFFGADSTNA